MSPRLGVAAAAVANWTAYGVAALVGFLLSPFVLHRLGNSAYGIWVLLASVVSYLGLLDLGIRGSITPFIARHHAMGDHAGASRVLAGALRVFMLVGAVVLLLAALLAVFVDRLFTVPAGMLPVARAVLLMGGASVAVSFVSGVFGGVVTGMHRFDVDSVMEIGMTLVRALLVVLALHAGYGLVGLAAIQLGLSVVRGAANLVVSRRLYPEISLRAAGPVGDTIRGLLSFSLFASMIHASMVAIYYTDAVIIGAVLPVGMIAFYSIAANLRDYARSIGEAVARVVTPRASATEAAMGAGAAGQIVLRVAQAVGLIMIPAAFTLILRGERFVGLWMGPGYAEVGGALVMVLALTVWFAGGRSVAVAALMGVNRHRTLALAFACEAVVNLVLSVILVRPLGLMGVALGTAISWLLSTLGFLPWYVGQVLHVPPATFARRVWLLPTFAALPFGVATYLVERLWPTESVLMFFLQVFALLPLVAFAAAVVVYSPEERGQMLAGFRGQMAEWRNRRSAHRRTPTDGLTAVTDLPK